MSKKRTPVIVPHSDEKQRDYERQARLEYGPEKVNESIRRWNGYGPARQQEIMREGGQNYLEMVEAMEAGLPINSTEVQVIVARWHKHIEYFYEPTLDILRGLGELYRTHPEFMAFFQQFHDDLPDYLAAAIVQYVDDLEYAEIERMLAADAANAEAEASEATFHRASRRLSL